MRDAIEFHIEGMLLHGEEVRTTYHACVYGTRCYVSLDLATTADRPRPHNRSTRGPHRQLDVQSSAEVCVWPCSTSLRFGAR